MFIKMNKQTYTLFVTVYPNERSGGFFCLQCERFLIFLNIF